MKDLKTAAQLYALFHACGTAGTLIAATVDEYRKLPADSDPTDRLFAALGNVAWRDHLLLWPLLAEIATS